MNEDKGYARKSKQKMGLKGKEEEQVTLPKMLLTKCPICEKKGVEAYAPFCSKRCADVDLHRWLNGTYAVPTVEDDGYGSDEEDY